MNLMDSYILLSSVYIDLYLSIAADWKIELRNLIVLRIVRIKIVLTVKLAVLYNLLQDLQQQHTLQPAYLIQEGNQAYLYRPGRYVY